MAGRNLQYYHHGRFKVAGGILPDAVTAYQTFGDPSNPCVVYPSYYGAKLSLGGMLLDRTRAQTDWIYSLPSSGRSGRQGQGIMILSVKFEGRLLILLQVLDPRKYYIVTFALFCNGEVRCYLSLQMGNPNNG